MTTSKITRLELERGFQLEAASTSKYTPQQELEAEVKERRERALVNFFRVQHTFFTENIHAPTINGYDPSVKGYDPLKYQRLINCTHDLLVSLEEWQQSAVKFVDLLDVHRKKPDFPENNTSPSEIAKEYHRVHPSIDGVHRPHEETPDQKGSS